MRNVLILFIFSLLGLPSGVLAGDATPATNQATPTPKGYLQCPSINDLQRDPNSLIWHSKKKSWRSYAASFTPTLDKFLGAQWQGVKVGTLFCIYEGDKMTFPVIMQYASLVFEPTGSQWVINKQGRHNCISSHLADCLVKIPKKQTKNDPDADLKSLRPPPQKGLDF